MNIGKSTHPWLTERGEEAVQRKHAAQGTEQEAEAARERSDMLLEEHYDYVGKMRMKLLDANIRRKRCGQTQDGSRTESIEYQTFQL